MTTTGPLNSPIAKAIDAHVASLGGTPLRYRMVNGKAQFWISINGRTSSARNLRDLADLLGVQEKKMSEAQMPTDLVSVTRASILTGYSSSPLLAAFRDGKLKGYRHGQRRIMFSRADVEAWAAEHRKKGGRWLPRKKRAKAHVNGAAKRNRFIHAEGSNSGKGYDIDAVTYQRLRKLVDKYKDTPMEFTAKDFVSKLVRQALDKMGA